MQNTNIDLLLNDIWTIHKCQESTKWLLMTKYSEKNRVLLLRVCLQSSCAYSHKDLRRIKFHTDQHQKIITEEDIIGKISKKKECNIIYFIIFY